MDFTNTSDTGIRSVICVGASTRLGGRKGRISCSTYGQKNIQWPFVSRGIMLTTA